MGDAATNPQFLSKTLPFSFYYKLFVLIHRTCKECTFSVFTSVQSSVHYQMLQSFQLGLAELFKTEGIHVSLFIDEEYTPGATDDALDTLAHMATADVLVTARSTFSQVAAVLNPNCVLFFPNSKRDVYLPHWLVLPLDRKAKFSRKTQPAQGDVYEKKYLGIIEKDLAGCIQRAASGREYKAQKG
jgi:hypothetical protein